MDDYHQQNAASKSQEIFRAAFPKRLEYCPKNSRELGIFVGAENASS